MAVDIRAAITCNLGTIISGSITDDYVQGTGLIKCRGSVKFAGLLTPAIGTAVEFQYTRNNISTYIPKKLRVLSSFADPFQRITQVELGCKLTYLEDLREPIKWDALDDPANTGYTEADAAIVTLPIQASSVMNECLSKLGITASSNPLTNKFSVPQFDFGAGYVQVLANLLVSESYAGYLDRNEVLQVIDLTQETGTGLVIGKDQVIDIGSIGAGQLPGESVVVSYSTLKLRSDQPAVQQTPDWTRTQTSSQGKTAVSYTDRNGVQQVREFTTLETTVELTNYRNIQVTNADGSIETLNVVNFRRVTESRNAFSVLGQVVVEMLSAGMSPFNGMVDRVTEEAFDYDAQGNQIRQTQTTTASLAYAWGNSGLPAVFKDGSTFRVVSINTSSRYVQQRVVTETTVFGEFRKVATYRYGPWMETIAGQQSIAASRAGLDTVEKVQSYFNSLYAGMVLVDVKVYTERTTSGGQQAPSTAARGLEAVAARSGNPNNGYRTESSAKLELALGSSTAQRRIELSMPNAPDDTFYRDGAVFKATISDADAKARRYGRTQNRLLLGNRSGMSIQAAVNQLPAQPFGMFLVQAEGLTGFYRTNGSSWTFDDKGIIHSTDALFWAAVGGSGNQWFPVAPGVTTLPNTPSVFNTAPSSVIGSVASVGSNAQTTLNAAFPAATNGQGVLNQATGDYWVRSGGVWANVGPTPGPTMTVASTVRPFNEQVVLNATVRSRMKVTTFNYAFDLPEVVVPLKVSTRMMSVEQVDLPATTLDITAQTPSVEVEMRVATSLTIFGLAPGVSTTIPLPSTDLSIESIGTEVGVTIPVPVSQLAVEVLAPSVTVPGAVDLPVTELTVTGVRPFVVGESVSNFTSSWAKQNAVWVSNPLADSWWGG